jgi:hypothetical protein
MPMTALFVTAGVLGWPLAIHAQLATEVAKLKRSSNQHRRVDASSEISCLSDSLAVARRLRLH